jgi:hypothetical protein
MTAPDQTSAKAKSWLDRSDPAAQEFMAPKQVAEAERHQAGLKAIEEANRRVFERECAAAGIDPAAGVSPSLLRALEQDHIPDE